MANIESRRIKRKAARIASADPDIAVGLSSDILGVEIYAAAGDHVAAPLNNADQGSRRSVN